MSSKHYSFLTTLSSFQEAKSFAYAMKDLDWRVSITRNTSVRDNGTWISTDLPTNQRFIWSKCVYKIKLNADETIGLKACLIRVIDALLLGKPLEFIVEFINNIIYLSKIFMFYQSNELLGLMVSTTSILPRS